MKKSKQKLKEEIETCRKALLDIMIVTGAYHDGKDIMIIGKPFYFDPNWKDKAFVRLFSLGFKTSFEDNNGQVILELKKVGKTKKQIPWFNIILFFLTLLSTFSVGAVLFENKNILSNPLLIRYGASFAIPLMLILLFHEFGHYFFSRRSKIKTSLPYFIPGPTILGTFGAVIKSKSPFKSRKDLLDVGASGPIWGFIISVFVVIIGFSSSEIVEEVSKEGFILGDSLIFLFLSKLFLNVPEGHQLVLSPTAFAGWAGLFVTMLNLLPIGQLDGGHITYALLGRKQKKVSKYVVLALIPLGYFWLGWLLWAGLGLFVLNLSHPPTLNDAIPLDRKRKIIGWISLGIFVLCFTPIPIK